MMHTKCFPILWKLIIYLCYYVSSITSKCIYLYVSLYLLVRALSHGRNASFFKAEPMRSRHVANAQRTHCGPAIFHYPCSLGGDYLYAVHGAIRGWCYAIAMCFLRGRNVFAAQNRPFSYAHRNEKACSPTV